MITVAKAEKEKEGNKKEMAIDKPLDECSWEEPFTRLK